MRAKKARLLRKQARMLTIGAPNVAYTLTDHSKRKHGLSVRRMVKQRIPLPDGKVEEIDVPIYRRNHNNHMQSVLKLGCTRGLYQDLKRM